MHLPGNVKCSQRPNLCRSNERLFHHLVSEVFAVCSLTLFLPICLEQFARDNGYLLPDKKTPCSAAIPMAGAVGAEPGPEARCVVKLGWLWADSASFR